MKNTHSTFKHLLSAPLLGAILITHAALGATAAYACDDVGHDDPGFGVSADVNDDGLADGSKVSDPSKMADDETANDNDADEGATVVMAHADIAGAPGSGITGTAKFIQTGDGILPTVKVIVHVRGLEPGTVHGMHIHETGSCASTAKAFDGAGGHFAPGPFHDGPVVVGQPGTVVPGSSNPDTNHPFHMGDLPNLVANQDGEASLEYRTSRITLSAGPLSVLNTNGTAIIVHKNPDQGITGADKSGVAGGPRIACGVIVQD